MTWSTPHLWQSLQFLKACWNSSGRTEVSAGAHAATVALVLGDTKEAHRLAQQVLDSCEPFTISFLKHLHHRRFRSLFAKYTSTTAAAGTTEQAAAERPERHPL